MLRHSSRRALAARAWLLRQLSRETSSGRFIPEMDGLRFVAITMVILFHLNGYLVAKWPLHHPGFPPQSSWLAQTALVGFRGVDFFFVISGFILALPFAAQRLTGAPEVSLRRYYLRRLTRLEPPYFVTLLVLFLLAVWIQGKTASDLLPHLGASLLYLHNLIYAHSSPVIGVAWSLEIEVQFYLLVPLLTLLFAIRSTTYRRSLLIAIILGLNAGQSFFLRDGRMALSILAYLQFFLIGFLLADFFIADWKETPTAGLSWDLVALIGWPLMIALLQSEQLTRWLFPFMILLVYCAAFRGTLTRRVLSNRWITGIGGMCYSIYLIHYEVIALAGRFTARLGAARPYWIYFVLQCVLIGVPIIGICGLYFVLLEKPCMCRDWPQRLRNRWQAWFYAGRRAPEIDAVT
jgi:peptidoglycan/LPS O-acetylase OafA/YrhL